MPPILVGYPVEVVIIVVSRLGKIAQVIDEFVVIDVGGPWEVDVHQGAYRLHVIGERPVALEEGWEEHRVPSLCPSSGGRRSPDR